MSSSAYADEGTIAHEVAAMCLTEGKDAAAYIGRRIASADYPHAKLSPSAAKRWMTCPGSHALIQDNAGSFVPRTFELEVTADMAEHVQLYVDMVRSRVSAWHLAGAAEVELLIEQSLPIDHITGETGATGTGDAVIVAVWDDGTATLNVIDLKFGMGVEVDPVENEQLQMYASGALRNLDMVYDFTSVCLTVHQPRINSEPSDWEVSIDAIREFEDRARARANVVHIATGCFDKWREGNTYDYLAAGDHCRTTFCDARAVCPKLAAMVQESVMTDFEDIEENGAENMCPPLLTEDEELSTKMKAVDVIEDWCKAVRAEVERRLLQGVAVPGYKLVQGRRGNRAWVDATEAEAALKAMRLKREEMYDYKLISPTTAEKLLESSPRKWNKVKGLITQPDGKPSVAPASDKRSALVITPVIEDFADLDNDVDGHLLYETGDPDAPDAIKDRNGEVALSQCKRCGRAEIELSEPCHPRLSRVNDFADLDNDMDLVGDTT